MQTQRRLLSITPGIEHPRSWWEGKGHVSVLHDTKEDGLYNNYIPTGGGCL